jgi:hypothetical protein
MNLRRTALISVLLAIAGMSGPAASGPAEHRILVELFTSQGCSDCPAADRLVTELASRRDVVALTLPITYWDMLGWKDTLATEANTQRQKSYAKLMGRQGLSTPQVVIGGVEHVVGNQRDKVVAAIAGRAAQDARLGTVRVAITPGPNHVTIDIAPRARDTVPGPDAAIWVMRTLSRAKVTVGGGENNKRELVYSNVVRDLTRLGAWDGEARRITLPMRAEHGRHDGVAVILQSREHGPVLGVAIAQLP